MGWAVGRWVGQNIEVGKLSGLMQYLDEDGCCVDEGQDYQKG